VDEAGNFLGHYVPPGAVLAETDDGWPTGEEIAAKAKNAKRWYTTAEVIAHLRSLG
jgi:Tat protein secretion system quality control protein TatD with DNase activity